MEEEKEYLNEVLTIINNKIDTTIKKREKMKEEVIAIGTPNFDEKKYFQGLKNKINDSGRILKELETTKYSPYFGRMDLKIIEDNNVENINMYIGEKSILNKENNLVYDWRSPVANLYYMNNQDDFKYNDTKYELNLKRQIDIKDSKLIHVYDSYVRGSNINITDSFLYQVLEEKKNRNEFTDIIRTIQSNQNSIIREDLFTNTIVEGVAGSGKTVVLLHRLSYLLYNYKNLNKDKLIFITPSHIFQNMLTKINRSLSLTTIKMKTMEEYYQEKVNYYIPSFKVNMITKDDSNIDMLKFIYSDEYLEYLDNHIHNYFSNYIKLINKFNLTFDINKIQSSLTNIANKIKTINYNTLEEKEELDNIANLTTSLLKKDNLKKLLNIIYNDLKNKYKLKNKTYIVNNRINKCYIYTLLHLYIKYGYTTYNDYNYIFIDEMQDYANNEFKLIVTLEKTTHLNLYGDPNQNILPYIEKKEVNTLKEYIKNILNTNNVLTYNLFENYRNTKEITNYCNNTLNTKMTPMGISSNNVNIINIEYNDVINTIINNFNPKEIVIITKNPTLEENLIKLNYEVYDIKVAKGLEFSNILVLEDNFNNVEKYISYTRALNKLYIYKIKSN